MQRSRGASAAVDADAFERESQLRNASGETAPFCECNSTAHWRAKPRRNSQAREPRNTCAPLGPRHAHATLEQVEHPPPVRPGSQQHILWGQH
eukprot:1079254-Pyramimonas_sp.AAC.1